MAKAKKFVRDPNVPVLAFEAGGNRHEVLVAGPKDYIPMACNGGKHTWTPNSLVVRHWYGNGLTETENYLHSPGTWGWLGRLIAEGAGPGAVRLLSPTDRQAADLGPEAVQRWTAGFLAEPPRTAEPPQLAALPPESGLTGELLAGLKRAIRALNQKSNFKLADGGFSYTLLAELDALVKRAEAEGVRA